MRVSKAVLRARPAAFCFREEALKGLDLLDLAPREPGAGAMTAQVPLYRSVRRRDCPPLVADRVLVS
jgi:hypothetical protein